MENKQLCAKCSKERGNGIFVCNHCYNSLKEVILIEVRKEVTEKLKKLKDEFDTKLNRLIQLS